VVPRVVEDVRPLAGIPRPVGMLREERAGQPPVASSPDAASHCRRRRRALIVAQRVVYNEERL
jgi:hypothetical protein